MKFGICGYGVLGSAHADSLACMDGIELIALCDTAFKQDNAAFHLGTHSAAKFDDTNCAKYACLDEMLEQEDLDALVIATPTDFHSEYAVKAMDSGCHVFCEKPMALTLEQCDRMIDARNRNNRQLQIGQCIRFWPEYDYTAKCISDGRYGKLISLYMERMGDYPGPDRQWFMDHTRSGAAHLDLHVHDVDWAQITLGTPDNISAFGRIGKTGGYDDVTAVWEYKDGPVVTIRCSWLYVDKFTMGFKAFFEDAIIDYTLGNKLTIRERGNAWDKAIEFEGPSSYMTEMEYFVGCIKGLHSNEKCNAESTKESIRIALLEREIMDGSALLA